MYTLFQIIIIIIIIHQHHHHLHHHYPSSSSSSSLSIIIIIIIIIIITIIIMMIIIIIIAFKGAIRDALQSSHCAANRLQHVIATDTIISKSALSLAICFSRSSSRSVGWQSLSDTGITYSGQGNTSDQTGSTLLMCPARLPYTCCNHSTIRFLVFYWGYKDLWPER